MEGFLVSTWALIYPISAHFQPHSRLIPMSAGEPTSITLKKSILPTRVQEDLKGPEAPSLALGIPSVCSWTLLPAHLMRPAHASQHSVC